MRCTACGQENREGREFCAACAAALETRCPKCEAINAPGERFCGECAAPLTQAAPPDAASPPAPAVAEASRCAGALSKNMILLINSSFEGSDASC